VWALLELSGRPAAEIEAECDALAGERGLLRSAGVEELPGGMEFSRYEFRHALFCDAISRRVEPARRIRVQRLLAERIEATYGENSGERAVELAWRYEQCLDWERAQHYLQIAAERARRRQAPREAISSLNRAKKLASRASDPQLRQARRIAALRRLG